MSLLTRARIRSTFTQILRFRRNLWTYNQIEKLICWRREKIYMSGWLQRNNIVAEAFVLNHYVGKSWKTKNSHLHWGIQHAHQFSMTWYIPPSQWKEILLLPGYYLHSFKWRMIIASIIQVIMHVNGEHIFHLLNKVEEEHAI